MRTAFVVVVLLSVASVIGCKAKPKPYEGPAAPVSVAEINSAKLQNAAVPQAVQTAFGKDHAGASISDIQLHSTSTGDSFYEISYISKGTPGTASYFGSGKPVPMNTKVADGKKVSTFEPPSRNVGKRGRARARVIVSRTA